MGFLSSLKITVRKAEAAVVIEKLLKQQSALGFLAADEHALANTLVRLVWDDNAHLFNDTAANLPGKLALAATALSSGINAMSGAEDRDTQLAFTSCLNTVLAEAVSRTMADRNPSSLDLYLIDEAISVAGRATRVAS